MFLIYAFIAIVLLVIFPELRIVVLHPFKTIYYGVKDTYLYFKHHQYDYLKMGDMTSYNADFGGGKTLSMAHFAVLMFKRFNNKKVWCRDRKKFVTQKVHIISNFELKTIPYEPLVGLSQAVCCAYRNKKIDYENDTRTCVLVMIDEASSQLNSRSFKTNIDPDFLNVLVTCRHYHISMWYSSQKFKLTDALMRAVTQKCVWCQKTWRLLVLKNYDADELEYASDPTMVKPRKTYGFFVTDADYGAYDTLATVDRLKKSVDENDMMSEKEILEMRGQLNPDNDAVTHRSFRHKMRKRR